MADFPRPNVAVNNSTFAICLTLPITLRNNEQGYLSQPPCQSSFPDVPMFVNYYSQKIQVINHWSVKSQLIGVEDLGDLLVLQGTTKSTRKKSQEVNRGTHLIRGKSKMGISGRCCCC